MTVVFSFMLYNFEEKLYIFLVDYCVFKILRTLEAFAGHEVGEAARLEDLLLVDVLGEVFLILRWSAFVLKVSVRHDVGLYAKGAECFNAIHILLDSGVEPNQHITHDFVWLDVARDLSEFVG